MNFFMLLFLSVVSIIAGIILTLVVQYYVLLKYFNKTPTATLPKKPHTEFCNLPEALKRKLKADGYDNADSSVAISLMMQFLFHELRHADFIKRWLYKKLSLEFEELITRTTTGKFFEAVTIRDMHLGSHFPNIKSIGVDNVKLDKAEGHIDTLDLCVQLEYDGNFMLSVDAKMKFGKTAYLSIKVKRVNGLARLQFTRIPYTHWSFSFYTEPQIDLAVESHFQGRQLQSNVTNLIVNQIKKAIKRKHTLPNYKIRYKPFFIKTDPGQLDLYDSEIIPQGQLEIMCMETSRLAISADVHQIYSTFAVDLCPYVCIYQKESSICMVLELTLSKVWQQQLGVTFKQDQNTITVDNITPQSPAERGQLKIGDTLVAIDGKVVNSIAHANKLVKLLPTGNISIRIERIVTNYIWTSKSDNKTDLKTPNTNTNSINESEITQIEQDSFIIVDSAKTKLESVDSSKKLRPSNSLEKNRGAEKVVIPKLMSASNENVSKFAQTLGNFGLRKRKTSVERISVDGSNKSTPISSTPTTPQHSALKQHSIPVPSVSILAAKRVYVAESGDSIKSENKCDKGETPVISNEISSMELIEVYKSPVQDLASVINCNDEYLFNLKETDKYLNINVWGISNTGKEVLLGYVNIALANILSECNSSMLGHYIKTFSFLPPSSAPPTSQSHPLMTHSGFEHVFCYGDALLSFMWTHDDAAEIKRKQVSDVISPSKFVEISTSKHDFVRTQFNRATHCDFCSKKIWLKDALQCKNCSLCCHKKCLSKCQLSIPCLVDTADQKGEPLDSQPEITMTEAADDESDCEILHYLPTEQKQPFSLLKRINSANNLSIPGSHFTLSQSRSLPPSPQHTPRKLSLVASNPFSMCPNMLDEIQQSSEAASDIISRAVDEVLQYPSNEALMDAAKETGTQLYAGMLHEIKVDKINRMVSELKKTLDAATIDHMTLSKQLSTAESEIEKAKLAFLIGQADAKVQALSVLMLHYCSGLQHTQEKIV